jgi:perosamine synthetase
MIPVNRPLITEEDLVAVSEDLRLTWISGESPTVKKMEQRLADVVGVKYVSAISNGTAALDIAIECLDLQEGDECIVPTFTIISTVSNLIRKKVKLKLVDSDSLTWSMNAQETVQAMTSRTKLVLPVHIYGLPVDMLPILKKNESTQAFILEDSAEALGVLYGDRPCGSLGDASIFSFYANKIVTGGEGGAIASNNEDFIKRVNYYKNLCFDPSERFVHRDLGWNSRINGLGASLIHSQLARLEHLIELKRDIGKRYSEGLMGHPWLSFMPESTEYSKNAYWVFPILLNESSPYDAAQMQVKLKGFGVESRRFFMPIHLQPISSDFDFEKTSEMKVSEHIWKRGLYIPSGLGNTGSEVDEVISTLWKVTDGI